MTDAKFDFTVEEPVFEGWELEAEGECEGFRYRIECRRDSELKYRRFICPAIMKEHAAKASSWTSLWSVESCESAVHGWIYSYNTIRKQCEESKNGTAHIPDGDESSSLRLLTEAHKAESLARASELDEQRIRAEDAEAALTLERESANQLRSELEKARRDFAGRENRYAEHSESIRGELDDLRATGAEDVPAVGSSRCTIVSACCWCGKMTQTDFARARSSNRAARRRGDG